MSSDEEYNSSDEELQEAFARGDLKPGLNIELSSKPKRINNIIKIQQKLSALKQDMPWVERLDMTNDVAPLAPELDIQLQKHEQKRSNLFKGNAKIPYVPPQEDPVLNDFKREMLFYRQAQSAVVSGIKQLHDLNIPTKRPDDYFAEMAKTDEHMQKIRANLMAKQEGQAKSERIRQIRDQRKMGKLLANQVRIQRELDKKDMLDKLKKFRKGKLKNLDFLEDAKALEAKKKSTADKRKARDKKFGFGGKKKGIKRNTKASSMGTEKVKNFMRKTNKKAGKAATGTKRLGKSRRIKAKAKKR